MIPTNTPPRKFSTGFGARISAWFARYGEDILIGAGLAAVIWASFMVGQIVGLYVLGVVLIGAGILIAWRGRDSG